MPYISHYSNRRKNCALRYGLHVVREKLVLGSSVLVGCNERRQENVKREYKYAWLHLFVFSNSGPRNARVPVREIQYKLHKKILFQY